MARIAAFALERQRKTATALFANLNGGRDENWSLATSCGLDAFERGGGAAKSIPQRYRQVIPYICIYSK